MQAIIYREFQGQGSGRPDGWVWCARRLDAAEGIITLAADNEAAAIAEAADKLQLPIDQIETCK